MHIERDNSSGLIGDLIWGFLLIKHSNTKKNLETNPCLLFKFTQALISPQPCPTEKAIERSPFFVRRGGHCCRGDLLGRTAFRFFFWVACKSKSLVAVACFLPPRAKDLSASRYVTVNTNYATVDTVYVTVDTMYVTVDTMYVTGHNVCD